MKLAAILGTALLVSDLSGGSSAAGAREAFRTLAGEYLRDYLAAHPVRATALGVHDHDSKLPDLSRRGVRARAAGQRAWLARLSAIDRCALDAASHVDYTILDRAIRAELLDLEEIRSWRRSPMLYVATLAEGAASLVDRESAPLETRVARLSARFAQYSRIIQAARRNLKDVPPLWVELALSDARGVVAFLRESLPATLEAQGLAGLPAPSLARYEESLALARRELESFTQWLERDLAPRAKGDFRLGRELFQRKLQLEEHVGLSVDELTELNEQAIRRYREWTTREAARLDPSVGVETVMQRLSADHPSAQELIPTARRYIEKAREFVRDQDIVTLLDDTLPVVRPTPEYARSGFASMSTPGPFETRATESFYNITGVDPEWSEQQQAQHLTYFNFSGLLGISVHEAMPGHFVHQLYRRRLPTDVRKVFAADSLIEGWAHYVEQMMVDEGLGGDDPAIRLGQLRRALQRHARWYACLALHAHGAALEDVAERFQEIAFFEPFPALRETQRGTYHPTYLSYALGRMQILELREDYRRHVESSGAAFSLREFHDAFLALGLPATLARTAMIPEPALAGLLPCQAHNETSNALD